MKPGHSSKLAYFGHHHGFRWRERGHAPKVRAALSEQGRLRLKELPSDTFLGTGVSVRTCLVVFDKPAA